MTDGIHRQTGDFGDYFPAHARGHKPHVMRPLMLNSMLGTLGNIGRPGPPMLGDQQARPPNDLSIPAQKRAYGWGALNNPVPNPREPIPVIYGKRKLTPTLINAYVVPIDDGQRLKMLFALGEGAMAEIGGLTSDVDNLTDFSVVGANILVNGAPIGDYSGADAKVSVRMGTRDQKYVLGFKNINTSIGVSETLLRGVPVEATTTDDVGVDAVNFHFNINELWKKNPETNEYEADQLSLRIRTRPYTLAGNVPWTDQGLFTVTGNYHDTTRRTFNVDFGTPGRWELRVTKKTPESVDDTRKADVDWVTYEEIQEDKQTYPYAAQLAVKLIANEDVSGSLPRVEVIVKGKKVLAPDMYDGATRVDFDDVWFDVAGGNTYRKIVGNDALTWVSPFPMRRQYSRNNVWCLYDFMRNWQFGLGKYVTEDRFNLEAARESAQYCHNKVLKYSDDSVYEKRNRLDIIIGSRRAAGDWLTTIMSSYRGFMTETLGLINLRVDKPETPAQLWTEGNTIAGTFAESFLSLSAGKNQIQVAFENMNKDWKDDDILADGADNALPKIQEVYSPGTTRRSEAGRKARYLLLSQSLSRSVKFRAAIDAVRAEAGDVISYASDVPLWGIVSGRLKSAGANSFTTNRVIVLEAATTYYVQARRAVDDGLDVQEITSVAGTYAVGDTLTIDGPWATTPAAYDIFSIGEVATISKDFRIVRIRQTAQNECEIEMLEYSALIYSDSVVDSELENASNLPKPGLLPASVENLAAANSPAAAENSVYVSWQKPEPSEDYATWAFASIFYSSDNGLSWSQSGVSSGESHEIRNLTPGVTYLIRASSVSGAGKKENFEDAPEVSLLVNIGDLPPNVVGLELRNQDHDTEFEGRDAVFQWHGVAMSSRYGLLGPQGAGNTANDQQVRSYQVEILVNGVSKRTEFVQTNEYSYTYEKNRKDNIVASREFTVRVWVVDQHNRLSPLPAVLPVENPASVELSGVSVTASFEYFFLEWNAAPEDDNAGYVVRRSKNPDDEWGDMDDMDPAILQATRFTDTKLASDPALTTYYYRAAAFDSFDDVTNGNAATAAAAIDLLIPSAQVSDTTGTISPTSIDELPASKIFMGIPILQGETWTPNDPASGQVSWTAHNLYFSQADPDDPGIDPGDNTFPIPSDATPATGLDPGDEPTYYIYWLLGDSFYTVGAEHPGSPDSGNSIFQKAMLGGILPGYPDPLPMPGGFLIAVNNLGSVTPAWSAIANQAIGSAYIKDLAVTDAKIQTLTADKITAGTIDADVIDVINLDADNITAGTIDGTVINVENLNADNIVTGTLTVLDAIKDGEVVQSGAIYSQGPSIAAYEDINISTGSNLLKSLSGEVVIDKTTSFTFYPLPGQSAYILTILFSWKFRSNGSGQSTTWLFQKRLRTGGTWGSWINLKFLDTVNDATNSLTADNDIENENFRVDLYDNAGVGSGVNKIEVRCKLTVDGNGDTGNSCWVVLPYVDAGATEFGLDVLVENITRNYHP